jgi:hypothetical protein
MADTANQQDMFRYAVCYRHLNFLWHFVKTFTDGSFDLPMNSVVATNSSIDLMARVWHYEVYHGMDMNLSMALFIHTGGMGRTHHILEACYVAEDYDCEKVAYVLGLDPEVVALYESLFFNIRDRIEEHMLLASLVYPETRVKDMGESNSPGVDVKGTLLKIGYDHGLDEVLGMAGVRGVTAMGSTTTLIKDFEQVLMANALTMAKLGYTNSPNIAINHAKQLLAAAKQGGDSDVQDSDALGAQSIGESVVAEVMKVSREELLARQKIQQEEAEAARSVS